MLIIKTDIPDTRWLQYLVDEFAHINGALFPIKIVPIDSQEASSAVLYYSSAVQDGFCIYAHTQSYLCDTIKFIKPDLFVMKGSDTSEPFTIPYDLFWNAFVFLSRYEEFVSERSGKFIHSYSLYHPRLDKQSFEIPVVNSMFNELEEKLQEFFPQLLFEQKTSSHIELSHDVDYINKTLQLRLKQTLFNGYNLLKLVGHPSKFLTKFKQMISFAFSSPSYWCFDYWKELEISKGVRSTFFIYVKIGRKNFRSWLIDPSYAIAENVHLQEKLKELVRDGFEIGLHGSYNSAIDQDQLEKEKKILEQVLEQPIVKSRQHWLNYEEMTTPYIHEELFEYDSTIGWNDRMGFRSGIASAYHPYDHINQKPFKYLIVPQVIMDSHLYDYNDPSSDMNFAKAILERARFNAKNIRISISWHQRVCSPDYNWHKSYEELLNAI